jgi:two-component system chemotaxis sensor kinase CheA
MARQMPDARVVELVCAPGFSTASAVTETSGRGVGMDVVKATLERLGGNLRISSRKGEGTTFVLGLPLTVAIVRVLVVEAGPGASRSVFAIPIARVEKALDLATSTVTYAQRGAHLNVDDELLPLYDLAERLGFEAQALTGGTALVVGGSDGPAAFRVEAVLGQEEVVVKPLGRPLSQLPWLSGATLLADGRAAYILEPTSLLPGHGQRPAMKPSYGEVSLSPARGR